MQKEISILFLLSFVLNFILLAENENIETIINANNGGSIKVETQQKVTVQALATPIKIFKNWSDGIVDNPREVELGIDLKAIYGNFFDDYFMISNWQQTPINNFKNNLFKLTNKESYSFLLGTKNGSIFSDKKSDCFSFYSRKIDNKDFEIIVKIEDILTDNYFEKIGVLLRENYQESANFVALYCNSAGLLQSCYRFGDNSMTQKTYEIKDLGYLRFSRSENIFTYYYSPNGLNDWQKLDELSLDFPKVVYGGVFVATTEDELVKAQFSNLYYFSPQNSKVFTEDDENDLLSDFDRLVNGLGVIKGINQIIKENQDFFDRPLKEPVFKYVQLGDYKKWSDDEYWELPCELSESSDDYFGEIGTQDLGCKVGFSLSHLNSYGHANCAQVKVFDAKNELKYKIITDNRHDGGITFYIPPGTYTAKISVSGSAAHCHEFILSALAEATNFRYILLPVIDQDDWHNKRNMFTSFHTNLFSYTGGPLEHTLKFQIIDTWKIFIPDFDSNGVIDDADVLNFKNSNYTIWKWWINNDADYRISDKKTGLSDDALRDLPNNLRSGSSFYDNEDHKSSKVCGVRDLIDFFPLKVNLQAIKDLVDTGGYYYRLSSSSLQYFDTENDNKTFITGDPKDIFQDMEKSQKVSNAKKKIFEKNCIDRDALIFIEGNNLTYLANLTLEIKSKNEQLYHKIPFNVNLKNINEFFIMRNFHKEMKLSNDKSINLIENQITPATNAETKAIYWVHGFNVNEEQSYSTFAEVYKRLYQSGYRDKFIGISWYGNPIENGHFNPHYQESVINSFYAAKLFADYVKTTSYQNYFVGHSLGNMVIGKAISEYNLSNYEKYFAVNAAVALESYGAITIDQSMLNITPETNTYSQYNNGKHSNLDYKKLSWLDYYKFNNQAKKVLPSEWYKLFTPSDNRSKLTWRNLFDRVVSDGKLYNFYSSTEDVLRKYNDDYFIFDGAGSNFGQYSWVKQEKYKGRRYKISPYIQNTGGGTSDYGGWKFSSNHLETRIEFNKEGQMFRVTDYVHPGNVTLLSDAMLKQKPLFNLGLIAQFLCDNSISSPSEFVDKKITDFSDFKDYDIENDVVKRNLTMRDWLLARAFPATTLPMGANALTNILGFDSDNNNFDMSSEDAATGFKTNTGSWPINSKRQLYKGQKPWLHSDYKDLSYQHSYKFYEKIIKLVKEEATTSNVGE